MLSVQTNYPSFSKITVDLGVLSIDNLQAYAVTEPGAGSDVAGIKLKAEKKGVDEQWRAEGFASVSVQERSTC